MLPFLETSTL
ncbi:hypothetical protein LINPERHAP1_LOCUS35173 [Linum perenne]